MSDSGTIAVETTDPRYNTLLHMPGRIPLKDGKGDWPADQFTFRLIEEGALREQVAGAAASGTPTPDPSPQGGGEAAAAKASGKSAS